MNAWFWSRPDVGLGQYLRMLVAALLAAAPNLELYLISPRPLAEEIHSPRLHQVVAPPPFSNANSYLARLTFEQLTFPRLCRDMGLDLAHVPYYGLSLRPRVATVATIHDLIPLMIPVYRRHLWLRLYSRLIKLTTPRARIIVTVSQASRRDIVQHLAVTSEQVRVVYSAPAPHFQPVDDSEQLTTIKKKYDLPDRYILYVGGYDAHKNIDALLQSFAQTPPGIRTRYPLVLAGTLPTAHTARRPDPRRQISNLRLEGELSAPGRIAAVDLPAVYSAATLFVYPSSYEGFGLPVLEAMACGTAVVTTTAASLPEVAGGAAWLVEPNDVAGLTAAIISLCTDREQNQTAVRRGLVQARRFSWQQTAAQTLQAYWDAL